MHEGDKLSTREKKKIGSKRIMLTVFRNAEGFLSADLLPEGMHFNSEYFINNILEKIFQNTAERRAECHRKVTLHFDKARPHTTRKVIQYMDVHHMKRTPHPPFSPDIASSDFFLFGTGRGDGKRSETLLHN